jgi:septal ring factor EnvC (AmiA/AmiB activator)
MILRNKVRKTLKAFVIAVVLMAVVTAGVFQYSRYKRVAQERQRQAQETQRQALERQQQAQDRMVRAIQKETGRNRIQTQEIRVHNAQLEVEIAELEHRSASKARRELAIEQSILDSLRLDQTMSDDTDRMVDILSNR